MKPALRKALRITLRTVLGIAAALIIFLLAFLQPGGSGVLASLRTPDGSQYMVTQRFNWGGEPYTVSFYMRRAGEPWGWCYIDHEAGRWSGVEMTYDAAADTVVVTERGTRRAALDRGRGMFWIDNGSFSRELEAPQSIQQPEFKFPEQR